MEFIPIDHLEQISKLRQRLLRLIKLGEPNQLHSTTVQTNHDSNTTRPSVDLTANVEECVRRLFSTTCSLESFVEDVQQILNVTIKSNLILFLAQTISLAHQYLQQQHHHPYSWDTFKTITIQSSFTPDVLSNPSITSTRLPSLQQARFRLPPTYPQLIDLPSSISTRITQEQTFLSPNIRLDANLYQQKLIYRFARHNYHLDESGEHLFLQTLYTFLRYIIRRLLFFAQHRTDTHLLNSDTYEMTSNVREQIRFLIELHKSQNGEFHSDQLQQRKIDLTNANTNEQKQAQTREYRLTAIEELRQKEADETACFVLRENRLKRKKQSDNRQTMTTCRIVRGSLQDLISVMENETILRRSKTLLYAYANR